MKFHPKTVYKISRDVLFVPAVFYKKTIGHTDRFIVALTPKVYVKHASDYYWFRMVNEPASHVFGVPKKYAAEILPDEDPPELTEDHT